MKSLAITASNIGKRFEINTPKAGTIRDTLANFWVSRKPKGQQELWALRDVSFEIEKGEVVGIIGSNGAGKSTLLKILSRITPPTTGHATIDGRIASLLEVGTGFHHELTGRENIFLNGVILGMSRQEVRKKFDEIVAFSGVEDFIDTPVKHYSSGMYVRLAFSVAAHLEADIIVIDEVLSVGDQSFQKKSLDKMNELAKGGKTILIVSHNMDHIRRLSNRTLLIDRGKLLMIGDSERVVNRYTDLNTCSQEESIFKQVSSEDEIYFSEVKLTDDTNNIVRELKYGQPFCIVLSIKSTIELKHFSLTIEATRQSGEWAFSTASSQSHTFFSIEKNHGLNIKARYSALFLKPGKYDLHLSIAQDVSHRFSNLVLRNFLTITEVPFSETRGYQGYWGIVGAYPQWSEE
jgi:lipopolysaccharide transport system ATP-binding protein